MNAVKKCIKNGHGSGVFSIVDGGNMAMWCRVVVVIIAVTVAVGVGGLT